MCDKVCLSGFFLPIKPPRYSRDIVEINGLILSPFASVTFPYYNFHQNLEITNPVMINISKNFMNDHQYCMYCALY
jgi:hypothetical protein